MAFVFRHMAELGLYKRSGSISWIQMVPIMCVDLLGTEVCLSVAELGLYKRSSLRSWGCVFFLYPTGFSIRVGSVFVWLMR